MSLLQRGLALRGQRGTVNSPRGILGGGGDQRSACDGCPSSSSSVMVRASFDGAPARARPPVASPWSPQAPPRLQLWRAAAEFGARQRQLGQRRRLGLGSKYA
jgi:hypothetical protein